MTKPLVITADALEESVEARKWYESEAEVVVPRFLDELNSTFSLITSRPRSFPFLERPYRAALVRKFPYYVIYHERSEDIEILAVAHTSRRPGYWKDRLSHE